MMESKENVSKLGLGLIELNVETCVSETEMGSMRKEEGLRDLK